MKAARAGQAASVITFSPLRLRIPVETQGVRFRVRSWGGEGGGGLEAFRAS